VIVEDGRSCADPRIDGERGSVKFGVLVNPTAGATNPARKTRTLRGVKDVLGDCEIRGLDTQCREDFIQCALDLAKQVEILVIAGGDGSFSDAINALHADTTVSYLPLGSGCALGYALDLPPQLTRAAKKIKEGRLHQLDLILCDGRRKAFMSSIGIEGDIINRREVLRQSGIGGPQAYAMATFGSFFADLERTDLSILIDGQALTVPDAVTAIVTKIPYYGYKMKVVPNAVFDDGSLHLLAVNSSWGEIVQNLANAFFFENKLGIYRKAQEIQITTQRERYAQVDGNVYRKGTSFHFKVLPKALRMWY
jgi:diacylglycerol kinase (ATP)